MIGHPRILWVGVFLNLLIWSPSILGRENREQLVATARDGNRAAIESIASMQCRFDRRPWGNTTPEQAGKVFTNFSPGWFWRSGDVYRHLVPMRDGTTLDNVIRNRRDLSIHQGGSLPHPILMTSTLKPVEGVGGRMWQWLLFSHWGRVPVSFYPFDEMIQQPHTIRTAERLHPPGKDIHIELTHDSGRLEFWFDPKVNYLIRKRVLVPVGDTTYRWEHEVIEFAEGAPAVFVPKVIEHRLSIKGTQQAVIRTILSDLKVNQPLDKDALRISGIAGMDCIDVDRQVKYQVDADGNRVGPEGPIPKPYVSAQPKQPSDPPTPQWKWNLIVWGIALVAALVVFILRPRRRPTEA